MLTRARLGAIAGGIGAVLLIGAALVTPRNPTSPYATLTFSDRGIAFEYPADWSARRLTAAGSFAAGLAKISSQGFVVPCQRDSCYEPPGGTLSEGGIWAVWESRGWPAWDFATSPGALISVDGLAAHLDDRAADDWCSAMSGTRSITVYVDQGRSNWAQLTACLRAPTERTQARLLELLDTVRFAR